MYTFVYMYIVYYTYTSLQISYVNPGLLCKFLAPNMLRIKQFSLFDNFETILSITVYIYTTPRQTQTTSPVTLYIIFCRRIVGKYRARVEWRERERNRQIKPFYSQSLMSLTAQNIGRSYTNSPPQAHFAFLILTQIFDSV